MSLRTPFDRRTTELRYDGLSQKEAVEKTSAEYLEMRRKADVHDELVAALVVLRARHQIDEPHHAHLCEFCIMTDSALNKVKKL